MEKWPFWVRRLEAQLVEEHIGELLRRVDIEGLADRLEDLLLDLRHASAELLRELVEEGQVEQHAGHLHFGQAGNERGLDLVHQLLLMDGLKLCLEDGHEAERRLGIGGGIGSGRLDGDLGHAELMLAGADQLLDVRHLLAQAGEGQILKPEVARGGVDEELRDHRVEAERGRRQSIARQNDVIVLGVVCDLGDARIGEWAAQRLHDPLDG